MTITIPYPLKTAKYNDMFSSMEYANNEAIIKIQRCFSEYEYSYAQAKKLDDIDLVAAMQANAEKALDDKLRPIVAGMNKKRNKERKHNRAQQHKQSLYNNKTK
ncbi:MAG: hypothetical protein FWG39_00900 [Alphaproteobacteria bacterium]|nr:hypothetical protein [Alphaproteobacteria bacterium]